MKKIITCLAMVLVLFLTSLAFAQDKVEAPIWSVGDKWVFSGNATVEIVEADENTYTVRFSPNELIIYDKSTLNKAYILEKDKRKEYKAATKRVLNFPLTTGKSWEDRCSSRSLGSTIADPERYYSETYKVLEWEDVKVRAGKFKAIKIEYKQSRIGTQCGGKAWYWYSPDVKYFIKKQYEKNPYWLKFSDWELISFDLKNK